MFVSGLVDSEKIGCSIEPMSSFGIASITSQMKKSWIGWRSGRRGDRDAFFSDMRESCFHTGEPYFRAFTQECQASCFHPWNRVFRAFTQVAALRAFAQIDSCFHTEPFVLSHNRG